MAKNKVIYFGQVLINLENDTVEASKLLAGYTAHDAGGEQISGACTFDADTSDATANAHEILNGETAYINGVKVTGDMPNRGEVDGYIDDKDDAFAIQQGYHDGAGTVEIDPVEKAKLIPSNIKNGVHLLGVEGDYAGETATSEAKVVTPLNSQQVVLPTSADFLSQVTINAVEYQEVANAKGTTVIIGHTV